MDAALDTRRPAAPPHFPTAAVQDDPRLPVELLLRDLRAAPDGLSGREAARRLAAYGPNELQRRQRRHWFGELLGQLVHPLALLL